MRIRLQILYDKKHSRDWKKVKGHIYGITIKENGIYDF